MSDEQPVEPVEPAAEQLDNDEYEAAAREALACPVCTAQRGERCRDVTGAEEPTHAERLDRYEREGDAA